MNRWRGKIGNRVRQLRQEKGVSARDMSLELGQAPGYISKIEKGPTQPSMDSFLEICDYLGVSPSEFFDEQNIYPAQLQEAIAELSLLTPAEIEHILLVLRDLNSH